jgi:maltose alpha-D-glucosyltransferase/alpha-amylase
VPSTNAIQSRNHALLVDLLDGHDSRADANGGHVIELPPYGYRWYRP